MSHVAMPPRAPVRQGHHSPQSYSASWTSVNRREEPSACTLPSISNLLNVADGASTPIPSPPKGHARPAASSHEYTQRAKAHGSYNRSPGRSYLDAPHMPPASPGSSHGQGLPPTPPMSQTASIDGHSPRDEDIHQFPPAARSGGYSHETTPPLESESRHHYLSATYRRSPESHHSDLPQHAHSQAYPPHASASPHVTRDSPPSPYGSGLWQHHHYLNPSQGAGYQQNPERYICPTCNKAFSRPSSLRIHSHSHTGEKPYKCAHAGCGKAFSVRSNMKRHERGCHSFEVTASPRFAM